MAPVQATDATYDSDRFQNTSRAVSDGFKTFLSYGTQHRHDPNTDVVFCNTDGTGEDNPDIDVLIFQL